MKDPVLRYWFERAYRAWLARCEQLTLFEEVDNVIPPAKRSGV